jgi:putative methanogenesis marker protein 8
MSEHLLEMAGALVRIKDGEIEVLTDPKVKRCPLRTIFYGHKEETRETVKNVLRRHIEETGMYTENRVLELTEDPVSFGASEMMMNALQQGILDACVVVCDGAGTVVTVRPEVVQAIGIHMTGIIKTDPIKKTQEGLRQRDCLLIDETAGIDQIKGVELAITKGFKRIAVTIARNDVSVLPQIRKHEKKAKVSVVVFAVHTTGITEKDGQTLIDNADLVWGCASKVARELVGKKAILQIGMSIPVFALTDLGKKIILNRALHFKQGLLISRRNLPAIKTLSHPDPLS